MGESSFNHPIRKLCEVTISKYVDQENHFQKWRRDIKPVIDEDDDRAKGLFYFYGTKNRY